MYFDENIEFKFHRVKSHINLYGAKIKTPGLKH